MTKKNEAKDAPQLLDRRDVLAALGAIGPLILIGCGSATAPLAASADGGSVKPDAGAGDAADTNDASLDSAVIDARASDTGKDEASNESSSADAGTCEEIPDETGGPYPDRDGMISDTKYSRSDITEGLTGTPLTLTLQVLDVSNGCAPIVGARVIIWHCDANGVYSEYASSMNSDPAQDDIGSTATTYLRGWQETDSKGTVTFTTIYPGWYTPRVTHIHVMVYNPSDLTTPVKTTQFCFPDAANTAVYGQASLYPKGQNSTTNASDQVFGSSDEHLVAALTGSTASGYAASLPVGLTDY
jgi:protocatechuate 3,4-dioxygenase beta subunit